MSDKQAKFLNWFFDKFHLKKPFESEENALKELDREKVKQQQPFILPSSFRKDFTFIEIEGVPCYYIGSLSNNPLIYLHGGGYVYQPNRIHFSFVRKLHHKTNQPIVVPIYPKTPTYGFIKTYEAVEKIVDYFSIEDQQLTLIGDSAGGGLALGLTMKLLKEERNIVGKLILISPFLDIALENPMIDEIEPLDKMLGRIGLQVFADSYASGEEKQNEMLSPIYGDVSKLPPILLFTGTFDILNPDCKLFEQIMIKHHKKIIYVEEKEMPHVYLLFPLPIQKKGLETICDFLHQKEE